MKSAFRIRLLDKRLPPSWNYFVDKLAELRISEPNSKALLEEIGRNPGGAMEIFRKLASPRPMKDHAKGGAPKKWDEWNILRAWVLVSVEQEMAAQRQQNSRIGVKAAMQQCFIKRRRKPIQLNARPLVEIHSAVHAKHLHDLGTAILKKSPQKAEMWQAICASELRHAQRQYPSKK
jgi:hypothetical protein